MFRFENLDEETRQLMLDELKLDATEGHLYIDPRLKDEAAQAYLALLERSLREGSPESFADGIRQGQMLKEHETRHTQNGDVTAKVPVTAADTLGEGEFNRYYMRALCRRALAAGQAEVEIYRAKAVAKPRPTPPGETKRRDAAELLEHLRHGNISVARSFPGPNSGKSIRLVK